MSERYQISPEAVANRMGEAVVLVHVGTDRIFELNSSAARIWDLLAQGLDRETISSQLAQEFNISKDQAYQETGDLLSSLISERIITVCEDEQPG